MKNIFLLFNIFLSSIIISSDWVDINSSTEKKPIINILSSDMENTIFEFSLTGFNQKKVDINGIEYSTLSFPESAANLNEGYPDLPSISKSIVIPNDGLMKSEIVSIEYLSLIHI